MKKIEIVIEEGTPVDDILALLGRPEGIRTLSAEATVDGVMNLVAVWTYTTLKLTLARREVDGASCYRVIKVEGV